MSQLSRAGMAFIALALNWSLGPGVYAQGIPDPMGMSRRVAQPPTVPSPSSSVPEFKLGQAGSGPPFFLPAFPLYGVGYPYFFSYAAVAVGDVNGDGIPDLVYVAGVNDFCSTEVGVLIGKGDGSFALPPICSPQIVPMGVESMAIADMNHDGKPDIVVLANCDSANTCTSGNVGVLPGNGDGTFGPMISNTYGPGGFAQSLGNLAVGDVNKDGYLDIVAFTSNRGDGTDAIQVYLGRGDGTVNPPVNYALPHEAGNSYDMGGGGGGQQNLLTDINGDGALDIVMLTTCAAANDCGSGLVGYLLGIGDGTFQLVTPENNYLSQNTFRTNGYLTSAMAIGDVNADGVPDIVTISYTAGGLQAADGTVSVLLGNSSGSPAFFPAVTYDSAGTYGESVGIGDVNGDGKPDLIVNNAHCPNCADSSSVAVLLGNGDGTFQLNQVNTSGTSSSFMLVADLKHDGMLDAIVSAPGGPFVPLGTLGKSIATSTELASGSNPSSYGQYVILTASVSPVGPSPPTGTVTFLDGSNNIGTAVLIGGVGVLSTNALVVGTHSITAAYSGDPSYVASISNPLNQVVKISSSTTNLTSSANPSVQNKPVEFTATVLPSAGGTPTGQVRFYNGGTLLTSVALSARVAEYTTSKLPLGSNSIKAVYAGDTNFKGSTSASLNQVALLGTTTTISSSPSPSTYGEAVVMSAAVSSGDGIPPNGETVTFSQGSTILGTGTLSGGVATFSDSTLAVGTNELTAEYGGDSQFGGSASKIERLVVSKASTSTALTSSPNPSKLNQSVTFSATVASQNGATPSGTVTFKNGSTTLGTAQLTGGIAVFSTTALAAGSESIEATYGGSADFTASTSNKVIQVVR